MQSSSLIRRLSVLKDLGKLVKDDVNLRGAFAKAVINKGSKKYTAGNSTPTRTKHKLLRNKIWFNLGLKL